MPVQRAFSPMWFKIFRSRLVFVFSLDSQIQILKLKSVAANHLEGGFQQLAADPRLMKFLSQ
eukprot:1841134-Amphidinium_carterae.1